MPTVTKDSHRGAVVNVFSTHEWMDCHDVARELSTGWTADGTSSVLSDTNHNRPACIDRREADTPKENVTYEYKLKQDVRIE